MRLQNFRYVFGPFIGQDNGSSCVCLYSAVGEAFLSRKKRRANFGLPCQWLTRLSGFVALLITHNYHQVWFGSLTRSGSSIFKCCSVSNLNEECNECLPIWDEPSIIRLYACYLLRLRTISQVALAEMGPISDPQQAVTFIYPKHILLCVLNDWNGGWFLWSVNGRCIVCFILSVEKYTILNMHFFKRCFMSQSADWLCLGDKWFISCYFCLSEGQTECQEVVSRGSRQGCRRNL